MRALGLLMIGLLAVNLIAAVGCTGDKGSAGHDHDGSDHDHDGDDHDHPDDDDGHGHTHTAPHGGALVGLGNDALHLEVVLVPVTGEVTAYVLDGEAERPIRVAQKSIDLKVKIAGSELPLSLAAVASELTGEKVGDTSEFKGQHDALKEMGHFEATLVQLEARGKTFKDVEFRYPEGNE